MHQHEDGGRWLKSLATKAAGHQPRCISTNRQNKLSRRPFAVLARLRVNGWPDMGFAQGEKAGFQQENNTMHKVTLIVECNNVDDVQKIEQLVTDLLRENGYKLADVKTTRR